MKITKNRKQMLNNFDTNKVYEPLEAIKILKEKSFVKFNETIDISINLGIDSNKTDQNIKGVVNLPNGTGKTVKVAVIANEDKQNDAKSNGADLVGGDELIEIISKSIEFDILIATPDMMPKLGKVAKILGPKGLMPNPKLGSVSEDIKEAVKLKGGSKEPGRNIVASISKKQLEDIAKEKMNDLNAHDISEAVKIIAGSARSMGIEVKE